MKKGHFFIDCFWYAGAFQAQFQMLVVFSEFVFIHSLCLFTCFIRVLLQWIENIDFT